MLIAHVIIAHHDPVHLKRMISALSCGNCHFYVHIDKKSDIKQFLNLIKGNNVFWSTKRISVYWGGYSQVKAKFILLQDILNSGFEYSRIVFMSGEEYPIKSNRYIEKFYEKDKEKEHICVFDISHGDSKRQLKKIECRWNFDFTQKNSFNKKIIQRIYYVINMMLWNLKIRRKKYLVTTDNSKWFFGMGSEYCAITYNCAKDLIKFYNRNQHIFKYLKTTYAPCEIFLHSFVLNSKYADNAEISHKYNGIINLSNTHHFAYPDQTLAFNELYYDELVGSNKLYIRKVRSGISNKLLDKLDQLNDNLNSIQ
jgi:hypothetical protein